MKNKVFIVFFLLTHLSQAQDSINERLMDDYKLAYGLFKLQQYEEAILTLDKVLDSSPLFQKALILRADCLFEIQEWKGAMKDIDVYLSLAGGNTIIYFKRGMLNLALNDTLASCIDFNRAFISNPRNEDAKKMLKAYCNGKK